MYDPSSSGRRRWIEAASALDAEYEATHILLEHQDSPHYEREGRWQERYGAAAVGVRLSMLLCESGFPYHTLRYGDHDTLTSLLHSIVNIKA